MRKLHTSKNSTMSKLAIQSDLLLRAQQQSNLGQGTLPDNLIIDPKTAESKQLPKNHHSVSDTQRIINRITNHQNRLKYLHSRFIVDCRWANAK